jgi:hypothetical protein
LGQSACTSRRHETRLASSAHTVTTATRAWGVAGNTAGGAYLGEETEREAYDLDVGVGHRRDDVERGDGRGPDGERAECPGGAGLEHEDKDGRVNSDFG